MFVLVPLLLGPVVMAAGTSQPASTVAGGPLGGDVVSAKRVEVTLETETGQAALQAAGALKKEAYGLEGEERDAALLRAAAAYGAVADSGASGTLDQVEGAFRAGEILRARGKVDEAGARFGQAVRIGEPVEDARVRELAARALLEQAHQLRREGQADGALAIYEAVGSRFDDCDRSCTHAVTWAGKLLLKEGRVEDARRKLLDFRHFFPDYPMDAVRNVDTLVDALVAQGQADGAYEAVAVLEGALANGGESMTEATARALEALRDKVGQSGY